MNKSKIIIFLRFSIILFVFYCSTEIHAQESKSKDALKVFLRIEEGITDGAVDKFSNFFGNRNYLSLSNKVAGYFSTNQSYYVIKDFLSIYQPTSFKYTNIVTDTPAPFASGNLKYNSKGIRGNATVFVSLQMIDNQWRISQITIN